MNWNELEYFRVRHVPQYLFDYEVFVPDISFITNVDVPFYFDQKNKGSVIELLTAFVEEEQAVNPYFVGLYLLGSIAEGRAVSESDVDVRYVIRTSESQDALSIPQAFNSRLQGLLGLCYWVRLDGGYYVIDLANPESWLENANYLNMFSTHIGFGDDVAWEIHSQTGYAERQPVKERVGRRNSKDIRTPEFHYPSDSLFPNWIVPGLIKPLD